jgi:putative peptidoglycan lipid II flippase
MYKRFLNSETKTINRAAVILAVSSLVSGMLGLFRDRLLAGTFGAGNELDVYYAAFRIPDFVAMVLIMGSISAAIIPLFSEYLAKSKEEAWNFFSNLVNSFLLFLVIVSIIMIIFVPNILSLIVPGFSGEKLQSAIALTRIMFLSPILLGISNIISGVLRVFKRFLVTSLSPIMYNIGIISGILFFVPMWGIAGLAWGVVFGALLHLLIQLPIILGLGFKPRKSLDFSHPGLLKAIRLTLPRTLGLAASQINLVVITAIGSTLATGSIAVFNLANNLSNLPVTFIGASFSTAAFPFLALYFSQNNKEKLIDEFLGVLKQIIFFIIPISLLIFILRAQIIRIILGTGKFAWADTQLTAACLGLFSTGIFAYGLSLLVSKTFYALHNTKIPALVALFSIALNVCLSFFFIWILGFNNFFSNYLTRFLDIENIDGNLVVGLPLALSLSGIIQLALLLVFLYKKLEIDKIKELSAFMVKILICSVLLIVASFLSIKIAASIVDMHTFIGVFSQAALSSIIGIAAYGAAAMALKLKEIAMLKKYVFRKLNGN